MSYERPDPERDPYTPRNDDDLPFERSGFDARGYGRGGGRPPVPVTLVVSAIVLLVLIIAVILFYRAGVRSPGEAPPVVGESGAAAGSAPEAEALNRDTEIEIFDPNDSDVDLAPPPEAPGQRPPPLTGSETPVDDAPGAPPTAEQPRPTPPPALPRPTPSQPTPAPSGGGSAAVQIGAFSSEAAAERAYADVAASFPQFAAGRTRGIQQVTTSDGRTVYRATVNGFSAADARAFCGAMRAQGRDCIVQ